MKTARLGRTGLIVSRIGFGAWQLGGDWGPVDEREALAAVGRAREIGINLFDTARAYGMGRSEELLGRGLAGELRSQREAIVLATKGGMQLGERGFVRDARPAILRDELEASLRALGVDHVDLYQLHWPDDATPAEETAAALDAFVREGKVRYLGVCNVSATQLGELLALGVFDAVQLPHNLLQREIETATLPRCSELDIGVLTYGPLAHGLLGGPPRFGDESLPEGDWRRMSPAFAGEPLSANLDVVRELDALAGRLGTTTATLALAWALRWRGVHSVLLGTRASARLDTAVRALDLALDDATWPDVEAIAMRGVSLSQLHWRPPTRRDVHSIS